MVETMESTEQKTSRILLIEDHAAFRQALAFVFGQDPEFELAAEAGTVAESRELLGGSELGEVDIAIVDLMLPDGEGVDVIEELHEKNAHCLVLVLSASLDRVQFARAVEAGAAGVIHKSSRLSQIVEAARRLRNGESLLSPNEIIDYLRLAIEKREKDYEARNAISRLTPRERQIIQALSEGLESKEIAMRLKITPETERTHMVNIFTKLGTHSRLQTLVYAVRHGLSDIPR